MPQFALRPYLSLSPCREPRARDGAPCSLWVTLRRHEFYLHCCGGRYVLDRTRPALLRERKYGSSASDKTPQGGPARLGMPTALTLLQKRKKDSASPSHMTYMAYPPSSIIATTHRTCDSIAHVGDNATCIFSLDISCALSIHRQDHAMRRRQITFREHLAGKWYSPTADCCLFSTKQRDAMNPSR